MSTTEPRASVGSDAAALDELPAAGDGLLGGNELVAGSFSEFVTGTVRRIRNGESGILPVVIGLAIIVVIFQSQNGKFLSAGNIVNLLDQGSFIIVFGMAEVFVLLLGEIDLSVGWNAAVGAIVTAELAAPPHNVNWALAILAGVAVCTAIGAVQGLLITRLGLPSFIVTLAFFLGLQGFALYLINHDTHASGGSIEITNTVLNDVVNGSLTPTVGWVLVIVGVVAFGAMSILRDTRRRQSGLATPPFALTAFKVAGMAAAGVVVVLVYNHNRGLGFTTLKGMHWDLPIVIGVLAIYTFGLNRTRLGRYVYAIGGNAEAARRAGVSLNRVRLTAFILAGFTAGIGGVILESFLGSASPNTDGGTNVLYAVAAAVIGGTSLFGGRGKMIHAVIGGLVIAAIANGMSLIALGADAQLMVNGLVLLAAVTVDAVARRSRSTTA